MTRYLCLYLSTLLILLPLDFLFLGVLAKGFFNAQVGPLMGELRPAPALLFYLMYSAGVVIFVTANPATSWQQALMFGALLGFMCYATFDLTMLSIIKGWTWPAAIVDITWGTFATGLVSAVSVVITKALVKG